MQYGKCGGAVCSSQCPGRRGPSAGACRIFLGFLNIRHFLAPRITDENADIITATCLGLRQGHVLVLMRNRAPGTRRLTFRGIMQTTGTRMVYCTVHWFQEHRPLCQSDNRRGRGPSSRRRHCSRCLGMPSPPRSSSATILHLRPPDT